MKYTRPAFPAATLLLVLLLAACGPSNNIRLLPQPPLDATVLPSPKAPSVSVVAFTDNRPDRTSLGVRKDNSAFITSDNITDWVSRALADELNRNGLQVSYAAGFKEARNGNPDYMVTGELNSLWLKEISATELSTELRITYNLANRQKRILKDTFSQAQSRTGLPTSSAAERLLQETLRDLVKPVARKIVQTIEGKK
ncbi:MAG: LPS assembly lipoprotein LptE [Desulfovibrio sp.]|jgi:hypothetical protein|nr:LPS assembly lipoprotein LptE [Desulfovibrio sp.]